MSIDFIRSIFYPLGFVANLLFGVRLLFQWIQSERKGESTVTRLFWILSLIASSTMSVHAFIQLQYPLCLIQALNGVIAWRNLNLMQVKPTTKNKTILVMSFILFFITLLFTAQGLIFQSVEWMRSPTLPWNGKHAARASILWHWIGFLGMFLFASRYWTQWWLAEKQRKSHLNKSFWWTSLFGGLLSCIYFIRLGDVINVIGYSFGLFPYIRNLVLIKKPISKPGDGLFVFAGESSGDILGSKLVKALRELKPSLQIAGVGGPQMRLTGMEIIHPMERFEVMGFSAVLKAFPRLYKDFQMTKNFILRRQPAGVIFIDYPDFNMRLAKSLRKNGYRGKLIHYVSPSVWAWRKKRVQALANTLDCLLSILPFEKRYFSKTALPVTYVGHPLVAMIDHHTYDENYSLPIQKPILAIFPGSRRHEIALNLPVQWRAAKQFGDHYTPVISVASPKLMEEITKHVDASAHFVPQEKRYELMRMAKLALATSGTIVLEIGLHALPTVVTYKLSYINYLMGRYVFRMHLPYYSLVNIISEKEVFPEFINKDLSVDEIVSALYRFEEDRKPCLQKCCELRKKYLLDQNASQKAAKTIEELFS